MLDGGRTLLPRQVEPGQQVQLQATVEAPAGEGRYILVWDMVHEGVTWFEGKGSPTLSVQVAVEGSCYGVAWLGHNTPGTMAIGDSISGIPVPVRDDGICSRRVSQQCAGTMAVRMTRSCYLGVALPIRLLLLSQ